MIYQGNNKIKDIYYGISKIKEIYKGSELIYKSSLSEVDTFMTATGLAESYRVPLTNLVSGLINNNLWTKLIAIYPFCGSTYSSLKYNLKDPRDLDSAYRLSSGGVGTVAYSLNAITANGNLNTFVSSSVVDMNSLSLSILSETNNTNTGRDFTATPDLATNRLIVSLNYTGGLFYADLFNANTERVSTTSINSSLGFYTISRTASNSLKAYRNGSLIGTNVNTRTNTFSGNIYIGGINTGSLTYRKYTFACIGSGLTEAEAGTLYNLINTFRNTL